METILKKFYSHFSILRYVDLQYAATAEYDSYYVGRDKTDTDIDKLMSLAHDAGLEKCGAGFAMSPVILAYMWADSIGEQTCQLLDDFLASFGG